MEQVEVIRVVNNEDTFPRRPLEDCCLAASVPLPESPVVEIDSDIENQTPVENVEAIPVPAPSFVLSPIGLVRGQRAIRGRGGYSRSFHFTHSMMPSPYACVGSRQRRGSSSSSGTVTDGTRGVASLDRDVELLDGVTVCSHGKSGGWDLCCTARNRWWKPSLVERDSQRDVSSPVA